MFERMRSRTVILSVLAFLLVVLFVTDLLVGSVAIPLSEAIGAIVRGSGSDEVVAIVRGVRLPEALTAVLAGAGLAACGLIMQTLFRNPLAGPGVLGISSGASLGVALVLLARPVWNAALPLEAATTTAAMLGALAVLLLIVAADRRLGDGVTLLIIGIMVGHVCGALISVLQSASWAEALKSYVLWSMGTFAATTPRNIGWLAVVVALGTMGAFRAIKPLNALLLGDDLAASMGVDVRNMRRVLILIAGSLAGVVTAFCGPVAFLGLATPHIARAAIRSNDHLHLMPTTVLTGAVLAVGCDLLVRSTGAVHALPLNAVTSLLGAPVVVWVLLRGRKWARTR